MAWTVKSARGPANEHCFWEIRNEQDNVILSTWPSSTLADLHLAAAAPDLFNAIRQSDDAHWTPAMRAAIRKALGEAA